MSAYYPRDPASAMKHLVQEYKRSQETTDALRDALVRAEVESSKILKELLEMSEDEEKGPAPSVPLEIFSGSSAQLGLPAHVVDPAPSQTETPPEKRPRLRPPQKG